VHALRLELFHQRAVRQGLAQRLAELGNRRGRRARLGIEPYQVLYSMPGSVLESWGREAPSAPLTGPVRPMARMVPLSIDAFSDGMLLNSACTSPDARSTMTCDVPLYGM